MATTETILRHVAEGIPTGVPDEKWRSVVMWCALLHYPAVLKFIDLVSRFRRPGAALHPEWSEAVRDAMIEMVECEDIPSMETLTRSLRKLQAEGICNRPTKDDYLARTL